MNHTPDPLSMFGELGNSASDRIHLQSFKFILTQQIHINPIHVAKIAVFLVPAFVALSV